MVLAETAKGAEQEVLVAQQLPVYGGYRSAFHPIVWDCLFFNPVSYLQVRNLINFQSVLFNIRI